MANTDRREFLKTGIIAGTYFVGSTKMHLMAVGTEAAGASPPPSLAFSRMMDDWYQFVDPRYISFVDGVQPQLMQVGFYGVDFWALGHVTKAVKGETQWPEPVDGDLKASGEFLENLNKELHERRIKVMGHFDIGYHVTGLIDAPQGPREGFFKFYNELWDQKELGPKPVKDPLELLQRKADGIPIVIEHLEGYSPWPIYHGCLNNPYWRAVLKAFVKRAIQRGVDGFIDNYIYTNGCMCKYCVRGFKDYLHQRYTPFELRKQFGIEDLDKYWFTELTDGYRPDNKMSPLRLDELRFSDLSRKRLFDEVFIQYGRSLKADLILAQWMHSYQPLARNDERLTLPAELWARGEDYLWYSLGYYSVGKSSSTLQLRYLRGAGGEKPYTVYYGANHSRALRAELAANGGASNVRHLNLNDAELRQELARFFGFMKRHDGVYHASTMAGECVLLHPRSQVHWGRLVEALSSYQAVGERLLNDHILFDVLPDDIATPDKLAKYKRVYTNSSLPDMDAESYDGLSRFEAPATVRISASRSEKGGIWDIHFVNYEQNESGEKESTEETSESNPIPVLGVQADLATPAGFSVIRVEWITPESPDPQKLSISKIEHRVRFTAPEFLAYGVARVHLAW